MRARLLVVLSVLAGLLVVGLGAPLAVAGASGATSRLFADRLGDTMRFAALAQRPITDPEVSEVAALNAELVRYDELYGIGAAVLDRQGRPVAASRPGPWVPDPTGEGGRRVALALVGQGSAPYDVIWPWRSAPMVLAEPVLVDGEVRGAALTVSPTGAERTGVLLRWLALLGAATVALGASALAVVPLVRWILAPVERLDAGTARIAAAVRAGRRTEPVGEERGPPELRRLTRDFDGMAATVAQTLESQRAFVADAGHQLRNPLTALRLRLQNVGAGLDDPHPPDDALRDEHEASLEEVDRLTEVLDALLALARAEGRPPTSERVPVDPVLADRASAWRVLAEHEGLDLARAGPGGLTVVSDPDAVATVLDAVIDNAVKYAPPGSTVDLTTARVEDRVEIAVRDRGPGLAPDELERATDRFWRSSAAASDGDGPAPTGTGLGLAIAARAAERGGGELVLELPPGGGLRVVLRLPLARPVP